MGIFDEIWDCSVNADRTAQQQIADGDAVISAYIRRGGDINARDRTGYSVLFTAASQGHAEGVRTLIAAGADVDAQTDDGETALCRAIGNGYPQIAKLLIEAKADANLGRTLSGKTSLMLAAERGWDDVVTLLLDADADWNVKDGTGLTALDHASQTIWVVQGKNERVVGLLRERAESPPSPKAKPDVDTAACVSPPTQNSVHISSQSESPHPGPSPSSLLRDATSLLAEKWRLAAANAKAWADQTKCLADQAKCLAAEIISTHMSRRCADCAKQAASLAQAASQATGTNMAELAAGAADAAEGAALYAEFLSYDLDKAMTQTRAAGKSEGAALLGALANGWRKSQQVANELFELCIVTEKTTGCKVSRGSVFPGGGNSSMLTGDTMLLFIPVSGLENLSVQFKRLTLREARTQIADEAGIKQVTNDASFDEFLDRIVSKIGAFHAEQQRAAQKRCFIATAACSTAQAPDVVTLRQFREVVLCQSFIGRLVSSMYGNVSPPVAALIGRSEMLKLLTRHLVVRPVAYLARRQMEETIGNQDCRTRQST
jgi:hypothetical protein